MKSSSKMLMRRMIGLVFGAGLVLGASTGRTRKGITSGTCETIGRNTSGRSATTATITRTAAVAAAGSMAAEMSTPEDAPCTPAATTAAASIVAPTMAAVMAAATTVTATIAAATIVAVSMAAATAVMAPATPPIMTAIIRSFVSFTMRLAVTDDTASCGVLSL